MTITSRMNKSIGLYNQTLLMIWIPKILDMAPVTLCIMYSIISVLDIQISEQTLFSFLSLTDFSQNSE